MELELIQKFITSLTDYDDTTKLMRPKSLHSGNLVEDCAISRQIAIASGQGDSLIVILLGEASLVRKLGGAQQRLVWNNKIVLDENDENKQTGIVITFDSKGSGLQHFCYLIRDLCRKINDNPDLTVLQICDTLRPYLTSLIDVGDILDENKQIGLFGELVFLEDLITEAKLRQEDVGSAILCWHNSTMDESGGDETPRDFAQNKIAVEVKTTSNPDRKHLISNIKQLIAQDGEDLYIFSASAKPLRSGTHRLVDQYRKVKQAMGEHAPGSDLKDFHDKLKVPGFFVSDIDKYELSSPFRVDYFNYGLIKIDENVKIFRTNTAIEGEERNGSFMPGEGPESPHVDGQSISYVLDLTGCEVIERGTPGYKNVLFSMLKSQ
jgi:hypothetical protein